jgi:flagellin
MSAQDTINLSEGFSGEAGVGSTSLTSNSSHGTYMTDYNVQATGTIANADVTTVANANETINAVDSALDQVNNMNATLGAVQNRFTATIANLQSISENVSSARSNMMDADFAAETANLSKAQILQQAGVAMVAQANSLPQSVLSLLK